MSTEEETLTPLDDLDCAFILPEMVSDPKLRHLYEVLISRMRREASHMAMNTIQLLLIERIAFNYVMLRHLEAINGFTKPSEQKDFNTFWLSMTTEFNKNLRASDPESKDRIITAMASVVVSVLAEIEDDGLRTSVRNRLANKLEEAGF